MVHKNSFQPSWVSSPGETILDILEERGWSKKEFSKQIGVAPKNVNKLLRGEVKLTAQLATSLSQVLGSTPEFWLNREALYRMSLDVK